MHFAHKTACNSRVQSGMGGGYFRTRRFGTGKPGGLLPWGDLEPGVVFSCLSLLRGDERMAAVGGQ